MATLAAAFGVVGISNLSSLAQDKTIRFVGPPLIEKSGKQWKIAFALSAPTDVEVAILDAKGKVIRHLAAGVLGGKNTPPEPLQAGLGQTLAWDGKNDRGEQKGDGPFQLRVRAGMNVKLGRLIGGSPYTGSTGLIQWGENAVVPGPDGDFHVYMTCGATGFGAAWQLRQFDRTGSYQRTLLPYPPSTDPAKASGVKFIAAGDGSLAPALTNQLYPTFFKPGDYVHHRRVDGCLVFVDPGKAQLTFFNATTHELRSVPMRSAENKLKYAHVMPQVAFSPDGRFAYYSNVCAQAHVVTKASDIDPNWPLGRIYRHDLSRAGADPEKFYDLELPDWETTRKTITLGNTGSGRSPAAGIDTDARGNIFVGDLVNQEVVELSPEGKKLSATKVPWPDRVVVSRKSATLYVVSRKPAPYRAGPGELLRIVGRGTDAKVTARLALKQGSGLGLALDESGSAVLWLNGRDQVLRVEDRGTEFAVRENVLNRDAHAIPALFYMSVDPEADWVYTSNSSSICRYNGLNGEGGPTPLKAVDVAVGHDGMVYAWGNTGNYDGPVARYSRDLKPVPLAATGKHTYGKLMGRMGRGNSVAGLGVDVRGWVYAYHSVGGGFVPCVSVIDAEGKEMPFGKTMTWNRTEVEALIAPLPDAGGGIRIDALGNVYVGVQGLPKDHSVPIGFEKDPYYVNSTGSILKFGPKGGGYQGQLRERKLPFSESPPGTILGYQGATLAYPGIAPYSGPLVPGSGCVCARARFDLDGYGRLYIPNAITFKVAVCDNAGNEIARFGNYGNFDAQGPMSAEPKPEIPLGWPVAVGASDKFIYVGDLLNQRIVRVDRTYAVEATCAVK
jgi:hypothetical protein